MESNWEDWKKWEDVRCICINAVRSLTRQGDESARDMSQSFVFKMMCVQCARKASWPFSEEIAGWLGERAIRHVRTEMERDRYRNKHFIPRRKKTAEAIESEVIYDLPDKRPGPEHLAIVRDVLYAVLREIGKEKPAARQVYIGRVLCGKHFTDIAKATGMTENALWLLCMRVTKRIKAHLAGDGLTEAEIADLLSEIDRQRSGSI